MELLALVQERIGPNTHWILLWDCALVHVAAPVREQIRETLPFCHLCHTSRAPPPSINHWMSRTSAASRQSFRKLGVMSIGMAKMVMAGCDHLGTVLKQPQLKADLPHIVAAVRNAH
eukprot:2825770-Amphidinium_carterae.2